MNFKPGDRVIFLNEKGGGVVTRIVSENIVNVAIAEGFEIPYAVKDLLRADNDGKQEARKNIFARQEEPEEEETFSPLFTIPNDTHQKAGGVYIAIIPQDQEKPLESDLDFNIVNHSPYQLMFGLYLNRSGVYFGQEFGFVEPHSKLFVKTVERTSIEEWVNSLIQVIFFREGKATPLPPSAGNINFKPVKIYSSESFSYESLLRKKAMMVEGVLIDKITAKEGPVTITPQNVKFMQEKMSAPRVATTEKKPESFLDKHKLDDKIAEVDLHIGELVDTFSNLSNVEMLKIQVDYFIKCMDHAIIEKLNKIIFIHGVGNGTLKNEISRYLRNTEGVEHYDAPYARYGLGATEVSFYRNKKQ